MITYKTTIAIRGSKFVSTQINDVLVFALMQITSALPYIEYCELTKEDNGQSVEFDSSETELIQMIYKSFGYKFDMSDKSKLIFKSA
jgi:hypothetical protein